MLNGVHGGIRSSRSERSKPRFALLSSTGNLAPFQRWPDRPVSLYVASRRFSYRKVREVPDHGCGGRGREWPRLGGWLHTRRSTTILNMTTAELLEALRALPPGERRALARQVLAEAPSERPGSVPEVVGTPVDYSHGWPVFTSRLEPTATAQALDHRRHRDERVDSLMDRALGADRD